MFDRMTAYQVLADDFVQFGFVLDTIERFVGADQNMRELARLACIACPKTTRVGYPDLIGRQTGGFQFCSQRFVERFRAFPTATDTGANEQFVLGQFFDRAVENMIEKRTALLDVFGEDLVDQLAIDLLVFDRHLPGDHHTDDRFATASAGANRFDAVRCRFDRRR